LDFIASVNILEYSIADSNLVASEKDLMIFMTESLSIFACISLIEVPINYCLLLFSI